MIQKAAASGRKNPLTAAFHFPLRRKLIPECFISGDFRNIFTKVVRSSSESRLYLSWNALQKISVNCRTLSPGDCMAFWTSRISSSAGVMASGRSLCRSHGPCVYRGEWRPRSCASHGRKNLPLRSGRLLGFLGTVCYRFGIVFQYHGPQGGKGAVHVVEAHGGHPVHIDFRVRQQLLKLFMGKNLTQEPVVDTVTF